MPPFMCVLEPRTGVACRSGELSTEPLGAGTFAYMDDTQLVKTVAADYIKRLGRDAVPYLRRQAARASQHGDTLSAVAWHDIADAAASIERPHL
jgi:hypothetical protein